MKRLEFQFELEDHGWARAAFILDSSRVDFVCAYGQDPIGFLATLAVRLAKGIGVPRTKVPFECEGQGEYIAEFVHRDPTGFELFHKKMTLQNEPLERHRLLDGQIDSLAFAVNIGQILDRLIRNNGYVGYWRKWQLWSFPLREYFQLRLLLDASPLVETILAAAPEAAFQLEMELLRSEPSWAAVRRGGAIAELDLPYDS